ncbi:arrestin domain-containing protein 3 [Nothobranchius furzeri]|uniref:Arrestin domain-containing protein 3-like n=1 Tax=Nothobranchius furzeri TaxID=105023 RepID=A0A9D2XDA2_NOTFU|nr:arrestin domain-containing protein 3-like [Nothobranchius furzeri]
MTIKTFQLEYDAINSRNTFTNGDTINGRIVLETDKEMKIQSLEFLAKGKASVCWTEYYGDNQSHVYWSDEKYYSIQQHILRESRQDGSEIIGKGKHLFPFSFKIPEERMPSSFYSTIGRVVHKLKAELKQSMKLKKKTKVHFKFVSRADMDVPRLMVPQHGCKDKRLAFGSGTVSFDVCIDKTGYKPGEAITVTTEINNQSSRLVKPKFILYEKKSFFAQGRRKLETRQVLKAKADGVDPNSGKRTVAKVIPIPTELSPSIMNCSIIKLEYRLQVYLDIKFSSNPGIKAPIIILPEVLDMRHLPPSYSDFGFEAFGNPAPPTRGTTPQATEPPPSYETSAMYPAFPSVDYKTAM